MEIKPAFDPMQLEKAPKAPPRKLAPAPKTEAQKRYEAVKAVAAKRDSDTFALGSSVQDAARLAYELFEYCESARPGQYEQELDRYLRPFFALLPAESAIKAACVLLELEKPGMGDVAAVWAMETSKSKRVSLAQLVTEKKRLLLEAETGA